MNMAAHKHHKELMQYAEDAAETDRPWDRWQMRYHGGDWSALTCSPSWTVTAEFRRKPQPMECWIVVDCGAIVSYYSGPDAAKAVASFTSSRRVAHMREVIE
jgi:hypothetical protein